uniref:Uncharacterized protein n=1 Tax=Castor canadensis TaxID=51338 RepID=A0A8C0ZMP4_CASCN
MDPGTQVSGLSSSLVTRKLHWKKPTKHSTPKETALIWSPRPPRRSSHLQGSPIPASSLQDVMTQLVGVSPTVTFRKRRLSTVQDSEGSSGLLGSNSDHSAAREEQPVSTLTKQQQKTEALRTVSWPRNPGLPGIPETVRRRRRDPREREAVMQRVRQWEVRLLQEIEAAVQHELTIEEAEGMPRTETVGVATQEPDASD